MTFTPAQEQAISARGNVLVMAGAGAGKTRTLVERCLQCIEQGASLTRILIVTFTEAAATELRSRLRSRLEERANNPGTKDRAHWREQLALFEQAHIGTLHGFCLKLIREHFYELAVDPQLAVLPEEEAHLLAEEALNQVLHDHYLGTAKNAKAVLELLHAQGGSDKELRRLVLRIHHYTQTLAQPEGWFTRQFAMFESEEPTAWRAWFADAIGEWQREWGPKLNELGVENDLAEACLKVLVAIPPQPAPEILVEAVVQIAAICAGCPKGKKGAWLDPLEGFCADTAFLQSLLPGENEPLAEDWKWARGSMTALLDLAKLFGQRYGEAKRELGLADFHDLEQFALRLLWKPSARGLVPSACALAWRERVQFVFVDEYQDINAAQDRIIEALGRSGGAANRFLVGDVKQSIYRFRLADPAIFRGYMKAWKVVSPIQDIDGVPAAGSSAGPIATEGQAAPPAGPGIVIPLVDNFRSRENVLQFINSVFGLIMHEELGGVEYDQTAELVFGAPQERHALASASPNATRTELLLRVSSKNQTDSDGDAAGTSALSDLQDTDKEARLVALHLKQLVADKFQVWDDHQTKFRDVRWADMAVLLRAPSRKAESYAKQFEKVAVPLRVERGGFYKTLEVSDFLSLLQILDNPLQDIPLLAVLHSPLAGFTMNDLAKIRLALKGHFWLALQQWRKLQNETTNTSAETSSNPNGAVDSELRENVARFLERYQRWRHLARQSSLSRCLDQVLAETHYDAWLLSQNRAAQRHANLQRLLHLAREFDQFQRQGLYRFLNFIEAQQVAEADPSPAAATDEDAVRFMSIHQSKGLEFPIVVVADLGKNFNFQELRGDIILDEAYGLCPRVRPPQSRKTYPSLAFWLAQKRQTRELLGEELRLLYVAMTRAQDKLLLAGTVSARKLERFRDTVSGTVEEVAAARSYADLIALWFASWKLAPGEQREGQTPLLTWKFCDDNALVSEPLTHQAVDAQPDEDLRLDITTARELKERLNWSYPFSLATQRPAKSSVSSLRRTADEIADEEAAGAERMWGFSPGQGKNADEARQRGTATHLFMQHVALEQTTGILELQAEAERMVRSGLLPAADADLLDMQSLEAFWGSALGQELRNKALWVRRELAFTARFEQVELEGLVGRAAAPSLAGEFAAVQGVADLVLMLPREIQLVDFKTDQIRTRDIDERVKSYLPQVQLYSLALERIYHKPVTAAWLYFLAPKKLVPVTLNFPRSKVSV